MKHFWQGFEKRASTRWTRELASALGETVGIKGVKPKMLALGRKLDRIKKQPRTPYEKRKPGQKGPKGLKARVLDSAFKPNNTDKLRAHLGNPERLPTGASKLPETYNKEIYKNRPVPNPRSFATDIAKERVRRLTGTRTQ